MKCVDDINKIYLKVNFYKCEAWVEYSIKTNKPIDVKWRI